MPEYVVRPLARPDLAAVARLAAELVRWHHRVDPQRFMLVEPLEEGYSRFFGSELADPRAVLLCATREPAGDVVGYAYGRLEPRDWNMLLDAHGALHDVLVDESARGDGLGERLVREACRRLEALGAARVLLHTAVQNDGAQSLFTKVGFRKTMIEMTREREAEDTPS
jgi:ribosomal protein S18 acetylase RimI-like enzyme